MLKSMTVRATLAALACAISLSAHARADGPPTAINVPAGDLVAALEAFSKQTQVDLLYQPEQLRRFRTKGVTGTYTPEAAVRLLLKGTQLELRTDPSGAMVIAPPTSRAHSSTQSNSAGDPQESQKSGSFLVAQAAQGQTPGANSVTGAASSSQQSGNETPIQEVIVTAQKREERLVDVPISIGVLSGEELQQRNITSIDDLQFAVPGLAAYSSGWLHSLVLRGVSNLTGSTPLVGTYLDEADVTNASSVLGALDLSIYDLARVEVLRGPQGTLYGDASAGGTVRFITNNPKLDLFEGAVDASAFATKDGAPSERVESVLNVPVVDNELAFRIAGSIDHEGGWIDQPAADRENINAADRADLRIKGLWQPSSSLTISGLAELHRNEESTGVGEDAQGDFIQVLNQTTTPKVEDDFDIYNVTGTYLLDGVQVVSSSSYVLRHNEMMYGSKTLQYFAPPPDPAAVLSVYWPNLTGNTATFAQELRLGSTGSGPFKWTVGAFYRHVDDNSFTEVIADTPLPLGAALPAPAVIVAKLEDHSWAGFGNASYQLVDRLTVGLGLRYSESTPTFSNHVNSAAATTQSATFHSLAPRYYIEYQLTDNANVYASASRGFRDGGFNAEGQPGYQPEYIWTYELGTKASLLDGRLDADFAAYYSSYTDYQNIGTLLPPVVPAPETVTTNFGDARIEGIEGKVVFRPSEVWTVALSGDYLSSRFTKITVSGAPYNVGDPLDFVPDYQIVVSAQRDFRVMQKPSYVRFDFSQQGPENYRVLNIGPWYHYTSDVIRLANLYVGTQLRAGLSVNLIAENLTNDRGFINPDGVEHFSARPQPRTFGVRFNSSW